MSNQRARRPIKVLNGMAVLDAWAHTNRFRIKTRQKASPGNNNAVCVSSQSPIMHCRVDAELTIRVFFRHDEPPNVL